MKRGTIPYLFHLSKNIPLYFLFWLDTQFRQQRKGEWKERRNTEGGELSVEVGDCSKRRDASLCMSAFPGWQESSALLSSSGWADEAESRGRWAWGGGGWRSRRKEGCEQQRSSYTLLGSDRRERLRLIQNAALAPWRRPRLSHTHMQTHTHTQPVHPNSCLVDPGLSCRVCRNIYQQEKQLVLVAAVMYARGEGKREGERESSGQTDYVNHVSTRQHYACGCYLFTGCCCKRLMFFNMQSSVWWSEMGWLMNGELNDIYGTFTQNNLS